jgi:hypothetical protein
MSTDNQPETKKNEKVAKAVEKAGYDNRRLWVKSLQTKKPKDRKGTSSKAASHADANRTRRFLHTRTL